MTTNYNKRPPIKPNGHKSYQKTVKYTNIFHFQGLPKYSQIMIFGLKINHLATLTGAFLDRENDSYLATWDQFNEILKIQVFVCLNFEALPEKIKVKLNLRIAAFQTRSKFEPRSDILPIN
jgi:hypothetical protein